MLQACIQEGRLHVAPGSLVRSYEAAALNEPSRGQRMADASPLSMSSRLALAVESVSRSLSRAFDGCLLLQPPLPELAQLK